MSTDWITVRGARQHNLKNIHVRLPRGGMTVITGLSGSGKSSLAFDTLYAEGQRRYVESLSAFARQFLDRLQKPDVDAIEGLSPAIAIEQRTAAPNPRSIVATATEIHDYLRLLYAHIGQTHCPECGQAIQSFTAQQIVETLITLANRTRVMLLAPLVRARPGRHTAVLERIRKEGFVRARIDGEVYEIEALPQLAENEPHDIELVVDRLIITRLIRSRLTDSVELTLKYGDGILLAMYRKEEAQHWQTAWFAEKNACLQCGIVFERLTPRHFSFNSPHGACTTCSGLGREMVFDESLMVPDPGLPFAVGAIAPWQRGGRRLITYYRKLLRTLARHTKIAPETPFGDLPAAVQQMILFGSGRETMEWTEVRRGKRQTRNQPFEGVIPNLQRRMRETRSDYVRRTLRRYMTSRPCHACRGRRFKPEILHCTVQGRSIADVAAMPVSVAAAFFADLDLNRHERNVADEILKEIKDRLGFLEAVGLSYLTLDRESATLSSGEAQRIRLATQIGAGLVGVLYVLDEPTIGLHARDIERLINILHRLRNLGNTLVVVEHDEKTMRAADCLIDLGPGAGRHGGHVMAQGTPAEVMAEPRSLTGRYLSAAAHPANGNSQHRRPPGSGHLSLIGASANNLKSIRVDIPLGQLVCVTGVSGSGKSTLIGATLQRALMRHYSHAREVPGAYEKILGLEYLDKVIIIDQEPIGRTPRSNPATYTGAFDVIRSLFSELPAARVRGYRPARFSFNVKGGRCETCKGDGMLRLEMHFLPDVFITCESCRGTRYNRETLDVRYQGRNIAEILTLTVDEALEVFRAIPTVARRLQTLSDVGLGYLQLGQAATTLSGGEAQRIKLAGELSRVATGRTMYLLDEPTTGLHFADVQRLLDVLFRLRDDGNSIVVIEHNLDVIRMADYIIDLGPEGGDNGGEIVVAGTPETVAACPRSHTGAALRNNDSNWKNTLPLC